MTKRISVIVPVFNGEKYIKRCIDSILNQSIYIDEIIIVNDNSSDNTKEILSKNYFNIENIKIINLKENKGVSYCRNLGIDLTSGEYIGFIDADDYIDCKMYEKMYYNAKQNNLDICICKFFEVYGDAKIKSKYSSNSIIFQKEECIRKYLLNEISPSIWDKIFKKKILKNIKFNENLKVGEDILFCLEAFFNSKYIGVINDYLYYYVQNSNSTVHTVSSNLLQYKSVISSIPQFIENNLKLYFEDEYKTFINSLNLRIIHSISTLYNENNKKNVIEYLSFLSKEELLLIIKDKNLNNYVKVESLIFIIFGIRIHLFLQPLYRKIRIIKYR